ncbi:MAG: type II toxin-antitoxin system VapC family toxin [Caulobacterales bacterium]
MLVIDASAMLAWCFEDESPANADDLLDRFAAVDLVAPAHWSLELANILWASERRGRLARADREAFIALVESLRVAIDPETTSHGFHDTLVLAARFNLSVYDAAYLELALRRGAGVVSKHTALLSAAEAAGVRTVAV